MMMVEEGGWCVVPIKINNIMDIIPLMKIFEHLIMLNDTRTFVTKVRRQNKLVVLGGRNKGEGESCRSSIVDPDQVIFEQVWV